MLPYSAWFRPILHISGGISMTDRQQLIVNNVDTVKQLILDAERWIWAHPQTGYTEWQAHDYLAEKYEALGYTLVKAGNIPGFYTDVETGKPGPKVAIFGELDALDIANHPESVNGMTHCCGHNAQSAALLGIAAALKQPHALDGLCGSIRLVVVPAEEMIQLAFREELRQKGIIKYNGGKTEFMYRGLLDGVDMAMMVHGMTKGSGVNEDGDTDLDFQALLGMNGCIAKNIRYKGKSAHAGGAPHMGVNAEYAAMLGLQACNDLRETFQEKDTIRFHPILMGANCAVNIIPDEMNIESYVRGKSLEAIKRENIKVNRALTGAALSMGAGTVWGCDGEFISAPRLDDLQCAFTSTMALLNSESDRCIPVVAVFDNEEVGSGTKQGAGSTFLYDILRRINRSLGRTEEEYLTSLASSFMVSADNGHAVHPNYADKTDPTNRTYLNGGLVIKHSANQKYTTDAVSAAVMRCLCERAGVPYQEFLNRSDILGGSTLGNISNAQVSLNTVDVGLPQLAMHSPYETAGSKDMACLEKAFEEFFKSAIRAEGDGTLVLE